MVNVNEQLEALEVLFIMSI